ncbi:MAG: hypothetical protein OXH20_13560 [bacterium]|nr:hypothetical protein [bacterium]MDE0668680.1 hypothetical protein [bacterium]MYB25384.1 hypothetical protein [Acidimicrobiia bacterium]
MVPAASLPGAEAGGEDPAPPDSGRDLWAAEPDADDAFVPPWWVGYDTLLAVVAFVALFRFWGLGPAIGAITVISLLSGVLRVRSGVGVGKLLPLVTIGVVARGVVGILTDNDDIYFGIGIGYKFAIAAALMLSAPLKLNPATDLVARTLGLPALVCSHEAYRSAVDRIIVVFGLLLGAAAGFDIWFLGVTDPDEYVLFRYLINWPLYVGFTTLSLLFLSRRLGRIPGFPGLMNLLEQQAEARTAARKRR